MRISLKAWGIAGSLLALVALGLGGFALAPGLLTPWINERIRAQPGIRGEVTVSTLAPWGATVAPVALEGGRFRFDARSIVVAADPLQAYRGWRQPASVAPLETVGIHDAVLDLDLTRWGPWAPDPPPLTLRMPSTRPPGPASGAGGEAEERPAAPDPETDAPAAEAPQQPAVPADPPSVPAPAPADPGLRFLPVERLVLTPTRLQVTTGEDRVWTGSLSGRLERQEADPAAAEGVFQIRSLPGEGDLDALIEGEGRLDGSTGRLLTVIESGDPGAALRPWLPAGMAWPPRGWDLALGPVAVQARATWQTRWREASVSATATSGPFRLARPGVGLDLSWQQASLALQGEPFAGFPGWLPGPIRASAFLQGGAAELGNWRIPAGLNAEVAVTPDATTRLRLEAPQLTGPGLRIRQPVVTTRLDGALGSPGLFDKRLAATLGFEQLHRGEGSLGPLLLRVEAQASGIRSSWRTTGSDPALRIAFDDRHELAFYGSARLALNRGLGSVGSRAEATLQVEPAVPDLALDEPVGLVLASESEPLPEWLFLTAIATRQPERLIRPLMGALSGQAEASLPAGSYPAGGRALAWAAGRLAADLQPGDSGPRLELSGSLPSVEAAGLAFESIQIDGRWPGRGAGRLHLAGTARGLNLQAAWENLPGWLEQAFDPAALLDQPLHLSADTGEGAWSAGAVLPAAAGWTVQGHGRLELPGLGSLLDSPVQTAGDPSDRASVSLDLARIEAPEGWDLHLGETELTWQQSASRGVGPLSPDGTLDLDVARVVFRDRVLGRLQLSGTLQAAGARLAVDDLRLEGPDLALRLSPVVIPLDSREALAIELMVDRLDLSLIDRWLPELPVALDGTVAGSLRLERRAGAWWPEGGSLALVPGTGGRLALKQAGILTDLLDSDHPRYAELLVAEDALKDLTIQQLRVVVDPPAYPERALLVYLAGQARLPARPAGEGQPARPARTINLELPIPVGLEGPLDALLREWLRGEVALELDRSGSD